MEILLSPSIMCSDLLNLEKSIRDLEDAGFNRLHIDVIDGQFAPSMPLGIETIKAIKEKTDMFLDVHIMSVNNEYFIQEMINIGVDRITFHIESSIHVQHYINMVKSEGIEVGIALTPNTNENELKYIINDIDSVLIMMINPGFANAKGEDRVSYAFEKLENINKFIASSKKQVNIQVDGRVSTELIPDLVSKGATDLVLGTRSLYNKSYTLEENKNMILNKIKEVK